MENIERGTKKGIIIAINMKKTGENIKVLVKNRKVSTNELSIRLGGVSVQAIYKWYRGECLPSLENLFMLKDILELESVEELIVIDTHEN